MTKDQRGVPLKLGCLGHKPLSSSRVWQAPRRHNRQDLGIGAGNVAELSRADQIECFDGGH
jgi:hypothetical protein